MIRAIKKDSPCVCGSREPWGTCCGRPDNGETQSFPVTSVPPVRFFVMDLRTMRPVTDATGHVLVFRDRKQALHLAERKFGDAAGAIPGMGEKNWERFQREIPFVEIVEEENVS